MSIHFSHGGPGGYKTSHAILKSLDVLFKSDRFYFTNVDGLSLTKLIPTFAIDYRLSLTDQFRLYEARKENFYNVSLDFSLSSEQLLTLMRYCPYWLPVGSFVLLDEVQLFYPSNFSQKDFTQTFTELNSDELDLLNLFRARFKHVSASYFDKNIELIKKQFSELYSVPLDSEIFETEFNHYFEKKVLYRPKTLKEFFSMHRHWGFDFELTCQDLSQVSSPIQHVAEGAHYHKNMSIVSSIYSNTYRTYFHSMLHSAPSRNDVGQKHKIDKRVFQCYKSTSIGTHSMSRVSQNIFGSSAMVKAIYGLSFAIICFFGFLFFGLPTLRSFFGGNNVTTNSQSISSSNSPVSGKTVSKNTTNSFKDSSSVASENIRATSSVLHSRQSNGLVDQDNFIAMKDAFSLLEIYVNGFSYSNYEYTYAAFVKHSDGSITKFSKLPPLFHIIKISTCFYSLFWRNIFIKYVFCYSSLEGGDFEHNKLNGAVADADKPKLNFLSRVE